MNSNVNKHVTTKKLFIILVALSLYSCNRSDTDDSIKIDEEPMSGQVIKIDDEIVQIRTKAVDILTIGSDSFVLNVELSRNFTPFCPPNGRRMYSFNRLVGMDSEKIPDNIDMVKQYVMHGDSVWIAGYQGGASHIGSPECYKIEGVSNNGPKWGPEISVEVISQINDIQTNQDYYVRQRNAYIHKTQ